VTYGENRPPPPEGPRRRGYGHLVDDRERADLADALEALGPGAFDQPTLCEGWKVRDVVAHMTATALLTPGAFVGKLVGNGFSLEKMVDKELNALEASNSDDELVALWRSRINTKNGPPGPSAAMLGEVVIHGEDIFRPLGAYRVHPTDHLLAVANFYKGSSLIVGAKRRIAGLALKATDADWQHGSGPEVSGPLVALIMAMTGRKGVLTDLSGEGVAPLEAR
jgi:uncharacterized protein (TIGR03083 family)